VYDLLYSQPQRWIPNCSRNPHPAQIHSGKETAHDTIEITHKTTRKYHLWNCTVSNINNLSSDRQPCASSSCSVLKIWGEGNPALSRIQKTYLQQPTKTLIDPNKDAVNTANTRNTHNAALCISTQTYTEY